MSRIEQYIAKIELQLGVQAGLKSLLTGISVGVFSLIFSSSLVFSSGVVILVFLVSGYFTGLFAKKRTQAIQLLHEKFADLEFSLQLLDKPSKNIAEQLQWERINSSFKGETIFLWHKKIWPFLVVLLFSGGVYGLTVLTISDQNSPQIQAKSEVETQVIPQADLPVSMSSLEVIITPPAYTGLAKRSQSELDLKAITGSDIEWIISFDHSQDITVELINTHGDGLVLTRKEDDFILRDRVKDSGIYAIRASRDI